MSGAKPQTQVPASAPAPTPTSRHGTHQPDADGSPPERAATPWGNAGPHPEVRPLEQPDGRATIILQGQVRLIEEKPAPHGPRELLPEFALNPEILPEFACCRSK
jgi:hypothetical protein